MSADNLFDLRGKKALVTGGAVGVGRACAIALATGGADVAIVDINRTVGEKTVASLEALGVQSFFIACDVSNQAQVQAMMAAVVERFGRLDIAINNAGIANGCEDEIQAKSEWDKIIDINLTGVWLCAQAAGQQMIKQRPSGGKIINTASMAATIAAGNGAYSASKAGVVHLTHSLAAKWGRFNINVNCFSPGCVMTPMWASVPLEMRESIRSSTPLGHLQRPEDLYGAILFLASEASNFVTGHDLLIDGGFTLDAASISQYERSVPPRVSPEDEIAELKRDLDTMGIAYDENGVGL